MGYNYHYQKYKRKVKRHGKDFFDVFSDREVKVLLIWALVGPFTALAYIIWVKYPRLKWLSVIFFFANIFFVIGEIGGWLYIRQIAIQYLFMG